MPFTTQYYALLEGTHTPRLQRGAHDDGVRGERAFKHYDEDRSQAQPETPLQPVRSQEQGVQAQQSTAAPLQRVRSQEQGLQAQATAAPLSPRTERRRVHASTTSSSSLTTTSPDMGREAAAEEALKKGRPAADGDT